MESGQHNQGGRRRAVAYLRVSTAGQAERGMGLEAQRDRVTELAKAKGYELVDVVREAASGGVQAGEELSYEHRPVLLELVERAKGGEYDALLVAKLDRLSRDYPTLAVLERRLQRYGVEVVSAAEENGDGPIAEFIRGQLALVAQLERAMIAERVGAGKAKRKAQGRHVHGRIPFGYRSAGEGKLEPDSNAELVRRIYTDAKAGESPAKIARTLNREGIRSPQRRSWSRQSVRLILSNPIYSGERYGVKGAQPAIMSRRTWNAVQSVLDSR
jgi:site-specific DNA recombinase